MSEEEKLRRIAMIHGMVDSRCYHSKVYDNPLKDSSSDINYIVDQVLVKHKIKQKVAKKPRERVPWKRIVPVFLISLLLVVSLPYLLPQLFGDFSTDLRIELIPSDGVRLNDTLYMNLTIPSPYNITSISADIAGVETIELLFVSNNSFEQFWQGVWFAHSLAPGEYIIDIFALDNINTTYSAGIAINILADEPSIPGVNDSINKTQPPDVNNTLPPNINDSLPPEINDSLTPGYNYTIPQKVNDTIPSEVNKSELPDINNTLPPDVFNVTNISIINPVVKEVIYVVPGSSFYVERTIDGRDGIQAVFAPLFSDGLSIEKFEIVEGNVTIGRSHQKISELGLGKFVSNHGTSNVERRIDNLRKSLPSDVKRLNRIGYSSGFVLHEPVTVRVWFRAPSWDDIISGLAPSSGRISYLTFAGTDFDFECSTWWNSDWNFRKLITVNSSLVDGDLTNFPILVDITDNDLTGNVQVDGDDIAFVLWSDNTTKLNHEIELYNNTIGRLVCWVNVTSLSSSEDTKIWMYYGNSACSSQQNPTGVWDSDYVGVWHLNESGTGARYDSTNNNNDGSPQNYDGDEATLNGRIAGADDFDGTNDRISITDSPSLSFTNNQLTMEAWVKVDALPSTETSIVRKENQWQIAFHDSNTIRNLVRTSGTNGWTASNDEDYTFNTGTWYYWTFVYDGSLVRHLIDSQQIGSAHTVTGNIVDNSNPAYIAYCVYTGGHINGIIDEVRIQKVARNSDWINTSFNTIYYLQDFIILDEEEELAPIINSPIPINDSTNIAIPPNGFYITIDNPSGGNMNITWRTNFTGSWESFNITDGGGSGVGDGTYCATNTSWITSHSTKYWWSVNVSNDFAWTNETYCFTTSYPPQLSNPNPKNSSSSLTTPICSIKVSDTDGGTVNVSFYENSTGPWVLQHTERNIDVGSSATVEWDNYSNATVIPQKYWWKVNASDGKGCITEEIYHFTTVANNPPVLSFEKPNDLSTGLPTSLSLINVTISDFEGDSMDWSIETSPDVGSNSGSGVGNGSISCSISGLSAGVTYYWYVNVTDGVLSTEETYSFITSYAPVVLIIIPSPNGTAGISLQTTCQIWANDTDGDLLNVTWAHNISGSYVNQYTNSSVAANSTVSYQFLDFTNYSKTYYWKVFVDDGSSNISEWFYFTTDVINTTINPISPYEIITTPLTITATGPSNIDNITLWYRYSTDNSSWEVPSNWWDSSWIYRKSHTIGSSNGAGTNYQVKIIVENSTGTDSGNTVYINNKAQPDFDDIRFVSYNDNTTELDYWIEEINNDVNATFWVEIPDNLDTSSATIWMYYGNNIASNNSNGSNTFLFFDDFSNDLSKWNRHVTSGAYPQIENGYLRCGGGSTSGSYGHTICDSDATYSGLQNGAIDFRYRGASNFIMEMGFRGIYGSNQGYKARSDQRSGEGQSFLRPPYSDWDFFGCNQDGDSPSATIWYKGSITVNGNEFNFYRDGELKKTCSDSTYTSAGSISCQNHYGSYSDFDDVRVRKYVNPEPVHDLWSSEEIYLGGTGCNWSIWNNIYNPDSDSPWGWSFNFPNETGYYEFYSIGKKLGSIDEITTYKADTRCHFNPDTSINITPSEWNIGPTTVGSYNYSTSGLYFNLTNEGNINLTIQIKASNATNITTGAQWKLASVPGLNNYSLQYYKDGEGNWNNINLTYDKFITNLEIGSWQTFDLNIFMATTSTKSDPLSVTITFRSVVV